MADTIRVGVVGVWRGESFAASANAHPGMELVALCDTWEERLEVVGEKLGVAIYTDFEKFLSHEMDAVVLANYFHQHAPLAIKTLNSGRHVMSETAACSTLAEGVELVEAVEASGKIYLFAENYAYMRVNQEMRRLYQSGLVGEFQYGEGEYVHPSSVETINRLSPGLNHWRNWIPATYYCTHSLSPVMHITDTLPTSVNGFVISREVGDGDLSKRTVRQNDPASMIAIKMDSGAVVKLLQVGLSGHGNFVRIHGSTGLMENMRHGGPEMLRLRRESFWSDDGELDERVYLPQFPAEHEKAAKAGHGGGDFFTIYHFAQAIRTGEQPYLDVYRGVAMSIVGIQAYRSALDNSNTISVPDFRSPEVRAQYADDHWTPDPERRIDQGPWPSVTGPVTPNDGALANARVIWDDMGYSGQ